MQACIHEFYYCGIALLKAEASLATENTLIGLFFNYLTFAKNGKKD